MAHRDPRPSDPPAPRSDLVRMPDGDGAAIPDESRVAGPVRGPETTPQLLRTLEVRLDLLRARGLAVPEMDLSTVYGRHLVVRALMLAPAPEGERGFDARDTAGVRYRIVGQRTGARSGAVVVPGIPERRFDRIVSVVFGSGFGVTAARMARTDAFLGRAEYREESNEWSMPVDDDFWKGSDVDDITLVIRTEAAQAGRDQEMPIIESISTPRPYPSSRQESDFRSPEA